MAGLGVCRLEQLSTELLCQIEGKEFVHPCEGRGEHQKRNGEGETSKWEKVGQLGQRGTSEG